MDDIKPRIDSITYTMRRGPERNKPQAGDERFLKGRGVTQIRQQVRLSAGPHKGMMLISNGRPVWEWVDKGSEKDRAHQWQEHLKKLREAKDADTSAS